MGSSHPIHGSLDRRKFLQGAGGSLAAGLFASSAGAAAQTQTVTPESIVHASVSPPMSESEKLVRIASNPAPAVKIHALHHRAIGEPLPFDRNSKG